MRRPIAIVTPTFPPYRGGMGVIAALDARQLAALGFDVHVFTPAADGREDKGLPFTMHRLRPLVRYGNAAFVPGVAALAGATILLHYPFFGGAEPLAAAKRYSGKGKLIVTY